jgi:hypothetical protein
LKPTTPNKNRAITYSICGSRAVQFDEISDSFNKDFTKHPQNNGISDIGNAGNHGGFRKSL